jgi:hypothetical protein
VGWIGVFFSKILGSDSINLGLEEYLKDKDCQTPQELEFWLKEYDYQRRIYNRGFYSGLMD